MAALKSNNTAKNGFIFMGGSYNPVHSQHLELLVLIKNYFEMHHNIKIVAGYLVITTDGYVRNKLKDEAISFKHRKRLCELISTSSSNKYNWIHSSHIQCSASIHYLQKYFVDKYPSALMINAMGADKILKGKKKNVGKWRKYSKNFNNRKCLTVCVQRKGCSHHAYNLYLKDVTNGLVNPNAFLFIDGSVKEVSSTMIRSVLKRYRQRDEQKNEHVNRKKCIDELTKYMNAECASYLLNNIDSIWYQNVDNNANQINHKEKMKNIIYFD